MIGRLKLALLSCTPNIVNSQIPGEINIYEHLTLKSVKYLPMHSLLGEWFCLSEFSIVQVLFSSNQKMFGSWYAYFVSLRLHGLQPKGRKVEISVYLQIWKCLSWQIGLSSSSAPTPLSILEHWSSWRCYPRYSYFLPADSPFLVAIYSNRSIVLIAPKSRSLTQTFCLSFTLWWTVACLDPPTEVYLQS